MTGCRTLPPSALTLGACWSESFGLVMYKHNPEKIAAMFAIPKIPVPPKQRKTHTKVRRAVLKKYSVSAPFDKS